MTPPSPLPLLLAAAACARTPALPAPAPATDLDAVTVPGPPTDCAATWLLPAPNCPDGDDSRTGLAFPGTWTGDGEGECALGFGTPGESPRWMFSPHANGYRGTVHCTLDECTSPLLIVVDDASPPADVLGEFRGQHTLQLSEQPIAEGPDGAILGEAIEHACPDGAYPGRPLDAWPAWPGAD